GFFFFFFQAEDGIRDFHVTGVQTCALPIYGTRGPPLRRSRSRSPEPPLLRATLRLCPKEVWAKSIMRTGCPDRAASEVPRGSFLRFIAVQPADVLSEG